MEMHRDSFVHRCLHDNMATLLAGEDIVFFTSGHGAWHIRRVIIEHFTFPSIDATIEERVYTPYLAPELFLMFLSVRFIHLSHPLSRFVVSFTRNSRLVPLEQGIARLHSGTGIAHGCKKWGHLTHVP